MAAPQNHWKLGLFVVTGLAMALTAVVILGARSMQQDILPYISYFDESVQGLEVGSPIKFRGVTIGTVSKIDVAPDHRHVEVESELGVGELTRLGLNVASKGVSSNTPLKLVMASDLRLQLASAGLTGVKFLQLDFFDVTANPLPELPFDVPDNYIPTAPSMLKNLDESLTRTMNSLPQITEQVASILGEIELIVLDVSDRQIPRQIESVLATADDLLQAALEKLEQLDTKGLSLSAIKTLDTANHLLAETLKKLRQVDAEGLSHNLNQTLDRADALLVAALDKLGQLDARALSVNANRTFTAVTTALGHLDLVLTRLVRDKGLLSSLERASDALSDTLRNTTGFGGQLVDTLVSVQAAARSIHRFVEALEQDPDMLLKGRSPERRQ